MLPPQENNKIYHICLHCGEQCKTMYCDNCSTKEKRKEMCLEGQKIRKNLGIESPYICRCDCLGLKKQMA